MADERLVTRAELGSSFVDSMPTPVMTVSHSHVSRSETRQERSLIHYNCGIVIERMEYTLPGYACHSTFLGEDEVRLWNGNFRRHLFILLCS